MAKGIHFGSLDERRLSVAKLYAKGYSPKEIWQRIDAMEVRGKYPYAGIKIKSIKRDIELVTDKWSEAFKELRDLENPMHEYLQKSSSLRDLALTECRTDDGTMDVRGIKLAADLDKNIAKVQGVYNEKLVIQVEDAQKLVSRFVDIIDTECSGDLRDRMMARLLDISGDL